MSCCRTCFSLSIALLLSCPRVSQTQESIAKQFVDLLAKRDSERATSYFDESTKGLVSASQLEGAWKAVTAQLGPLSKQLGVRTETMVNAPGPGL